MSKELYFTDGNNEVKYLDTTASFNLAITQDGSAFDLTNATAIDVKVANDTGYVFEKSIDMTTIKQPLAGLITMPVDAEVMNALVPDDYTIEVWVTLSSLITPGSQEGLTDDGATSATTTSATGTTTYNAIFPSDDPQGFTITENVMSDSGDVIPVMSLDDFQQEFDQLKTDLTNKVSTLQGPKGDTGQGLEIKGKVDTTSQLPATASEGDGYLVGEELYVWTNSAWKDCGPIQGPQGVQGIQGKTGTGISSTTIQYQISSSATTAPTGTWSDNIIATTTANPNLWMKATLNYTDGTTKDFYLVSQKGDKGDKGDTGDTGPIGAPGPVGAGLTVKGSFDNASQLPKDGNQEGYCYFVGTDLYVWVNGAWKNCGNVSPDLSNYVTVTDLNNGLSTKVTDNKNGTEQLNGVQVQPFNKLSDTIGGRNLYLNSKAIAEGYGTIGDTKVTVEPFDSATNMWHIVAKQDGSGFHGIYSYNYVQDRLPDTSDWSCSFDVKGIGKIACIGMENSSRNPVSGTVGSEWSRISQTGHIDNVAGEKAIIMYFYANGSPLDVYIKLPKFELGNMPMDWTPAPEDKVNVSDMRKPASDVAGIEEVNAKQDKIGYTPADDSKVAHLSGTNNFDTVPTVNNNPLLLASSLPAELARTGSDQEFTGKNTFDTAPIDKTTGNPYITKDGVPSIPSDVARTSQKTNFTAGLQSGGVDVATAADLKSVEDAAWRQLDNKYITSDIAISSASTVLYKIDDTNKRLYLQGSVMLSSYGYDAITLHLDSIVNRVLTVTGSYLGRISAYQNWTNITADSSLTFNPQSGLVQFSGDNYSPLESKGPLYITYDKLV